MDLSSLHHPPGSRKNRRRVGRGPSSGRGKTSGKGHKGQQSRSGYSRHHGYEGGQMPLHRRLPKRGFRHGDRWPMGIVNLDLIEKHFADGETVDRETLLRAGLVKETPGGVKASKKLTVTVQAITESARKKIEQAGGSVTVEPLRKPAAAAAPVRAEAPQTEQE